MLISSARSILLVVDLQKKLMPVIHNKQEIENRTCILLKAAKRLDIPVIITEQYPKGLGVTEQQILCDSPDNSLIISKLTFSAGKNVDVCSTLADWKQRGRDQIIVCGTETHICVLQSVMDLITLSFKLFIVEDASGSRTALNHKAGIKRMRLAGANCVTSEMVVFEWLEVAGTKLFKEISTLIR